jgi:hypothetical protein
MRYAIVLVLVAVFSIPSHGGQKATQPSVSQHKSVKADAHTSANALDWDDAYARSGAVRRL